MGILTLYLSLIPLGHCTDMSRWINSLAQIAGGELDTGYLACEEFGLEVTPVPIVNDLPVPVIVDTRSGGASPIVYTLPEAAVPSPPEEPVQLPIDAHMMTTPAPVAMARVYTTLHPGRVLHSRPTTSAAAPIVRRRGSKRNRDDESEPGPESSSITENDDGEDGPGESSGGLSMLDRGRGYALLAANPDIPKDDFVASLINSNPDLDKRRVNCFFSNALQRRRFPRFVRDYLDTHRSLLKGDPSRGSLRNALKLLYLNAGFRRGNDIPSKAIRMWGQLVLTESPHGHTTETIRGVEHLRLSPEAQVKLFTQLWVECGSPPAPLVVSAPTPVRPSTATRLTEGDHVTAFELLELHPSWKLSQLIHAFLETCPGVPETTVRAMFKRYRGWTKVPLWMHQTITRNIHLATDNMKRLIELVLAAAARRDQKYARAPAQFVKDWIRFCVPANADSPEPCIHETRGMGVFVKMPDDVQTVFFAGKREQWTARPITSQKHKKDSE